MIIFNNPQCEAITNSIHFGICDDEGDNKTPAYLDFKDHDKWIATVNNRTAKEVKFIAIDNCVLIKRQNNSLSKRCDGMLICSNKLIMIELKSKHQDWKAIGLKQIEETLQYIIKENLEYYFSFSKRIIVVANVKKSKPGFQDSDIQLREKFFKEYKIRIQFENIINIS